MRTTECPLVAYFALEQNDEVVQWAQWRHTWTETEPIRTPLCGFETLSREALHLPLLPR